MSDNVIRLNTSRNLRLVQTQIAAQETPYMQIVSLTADITDQLDAVIRNLRASGHTYEADILASTKADVKYHLATAAEQAMAASGSYYE